MLQSKTKGPSAFILCLLFLPLLLMAAEVEPSETVNPFVRFSEGRLTIKAVEVSLEDLLQEITEKSGIVVELRDHETAEKRLTLNLVNISPGEVFKEILRGFNFVFFYDQVRLARVVALSATLPPESPPAQLSLPRLSFKPPPSDSKPSRSDSAPDFERLLERNRDEGMKALREALAHPDPEVKQSALETLADQEGPDVVPILTGALRDPDPSFRMEVLEALADRGELQFVKGALSDQNGQVRKKAAELLESDGEGENKTP